jgi:thioredoxin reductase (NADPH)
VTLVFPEPATHAQPYLMEALADKTNIALIPRSRIAGIDGTDGVTGVQVEGPDGLAQSLPVQGVFVYAGLHPNTGFLHGALRLDAQARIETDDRLCSSEPGIYAAGDIRAGARHLLVNAAQDGEQAARAAIEYIKGDKK